MHLLVALVWLVAAGQTKGSDFERLQAIAGEWKGATPSGKPLAVTYKAMSAGTALVETYGVGSGRETLTVFHRDGASVVATHYCAQGNQPRLRLQSAAPKRWVFAFADATNLPDAKASHLVLLELQLTDGDHLVRTETYREGGKDDVTKLELVRVPVP